MSSNADHRTTILVTKIGEKEKESHLYFYNDFIEGTPLINMSKYMLDFLVMVSSLLDT